MGCGPRGPWDEATYVAEDLSSNVLAIGGVAELDGARDDEALELRMNALLRLQQISAAAAARQPTASDGSAASARAPASAQSNDAVAAFVAEMAFAGAPAPLLTREGFQVHLSGDGKGGVRAALHAALVLHAALGSARPNAANELQAE